MKIINILSEVCKKKLVKENLSAFSHHTYYSNKYLLWLFLSQFFFIVVSLFIYLLFFTFILREKNPNLFISSSVK